MPALAPAHHRAEADHLTFALPPSHRHHVESTTTTKRAPAVSTADAEATSGLFFGDFCLFCGNPAQPGSLAYCSRDCELADSADRELNGDRDHASGASDLDSNAPPLASSRGSTPPSSANSSPLAYPHAGPDHHIARLDLPPSVAVAIGQPAKTGLAYDYMYRLKPSSPTHTEMDPSTLHHHHADVLKLHRPVRPSVSLPQSLLLSPKLRPSTMMAMSHHHTHPAAVPSISRRPSAPTKLSATSRRASAPILDKPDPDVLADLDQRSFENHSAFAALLFERPTASTSSSAAMGKTLSEGNRSRSASVGNALVASSSSSTPARPKRFLFGRRPTPEPPAPAPLTSTNPNVAPTPTDDGSGGRGRRSNRNAFDQAASGQRSRSPKSKSASRNRERERMRWAVP